MKKDPLSINKIAAGIITAALFIMALGYLPAIFFPGHESNEGELAYKIRSPNDVSGDTAAVAAKDVIAPIAPLLAAADAGAGQSVAGKCVACHTFDAGGPNKIGPNLYNVVNRDIGSADGYKYSKILQELPDAWSYEELNKFLIKPKTYAPGTKMAYAGLRKEKDRANIIAYLRSLSDNPAALPE